MCQNCNHKRVMYSTGNNRSQQGMIKVKLIAGNSLIMNGDITGRVYTFRKINDINWVDRRDVISMKDIKALQIIF